MTLTDLDHYFVRANDLEATKDWYCDVLGLEVMPRPSFGFPGYWLGVGGKVQVHMGQHGADGADRHYHGSTPASATDQTGVIDHIAFRAAGAQAFHDRLKVLGVTAVHRFHPALHLCQLFLEDPNGVTIELNFADTATEPAW